MSEKPDQTYAEIIADDATGAPEFLSHAEFPDIGTEPIAAERYYSKEFFELENKYLWPRVWQMACHRDDIPEIGNCYHYEISDRSLIIVHTEQGFRAFYNACLHRGRKLITGHCKKDKFECPFHAITWSLDGEMIYNPIAWDMPQWTPENSKLPEARIAEWGGFIFVCMDPFAPEFEVVAGPMINDLARYDWENRYRAWWVEKHVNANWKTVAEPFMESHHSQTTHPQLLYSIADINSQYDFLNAYVSRQISAAASASPSLDPQPTNLEQVAKMIERGDGRVAGLNIDELPDDFNTRTHLGNFQRDQLTKSLGRDHSHATDAEVLDYLLYGVFPHMVFWAGYGGKLVYRWRPNSKHPEASIMDIIYMQPLADGAERPAPAQKQVVGPDESLKTVTGMPGPLKLVFEQDFGNIPHVQNGLRSLESGEINLSSYTESRIRFMHQLIDRFIYTGQDGEQPPGAEL